MREAPNATVASLSGLESAWNILYCTTDANYNPTFAVTTLLVPKGSDRKSMVSYQIAYDTVDVDHSPSYLMNDYYNAPMDQSLILPLLLNRGWVVNMPDYEGPNATFSSGHMQGHAVLDSVRSVLASGDHFNISSDVRYALYGYSGGSIASEWAAELQPAYAPELNFVGTAIGGLPANLTECVYYHSTGDAVGTAVTVILGLAKQHPALDKVVRAGLRSSGKYNETGFLADYHYGITETADAFKQQDIRWYFEDGLNWMKQPEIQRIFNNDGIMGYHGIPQMPLFIYHAVEDHTAPIDGSDSVFERYCRVGVDIEYRRNNAGNHETEGLLGGIIGTDWLAGAFAGSVPAQHGCFKEGVTREVTKLDIQRFTLELQKQGLDASKLIPDGNE